MSKPIIDAMARGMRSSKAWPVVFSAGAADELARAALQEIECIGYAVVPVVPTDAMVDNSRLLPMQTARSLADDEVRNWLAEHPDPDTVMSRPVPRGQKWRG